MTRILKGIVVSAKQDRTVVVRVDRVKTHPIYRKQYKVSTKFMATDTLGHKEGDIVAIQETKPESKNKRWKVIEGKGSKK